MADRIKGITIEIGGDTTGLRKALNGVNSEIRGTQSQLKDVERLLKLDPTNTELLRQKHRLLAEAVSETKEKLSTLKEAEKQVQIQFEQGKVSREQYEGLKREIAETERQLKDLETQAANSNLALKKIGEAGDALQKAGEKVTSAGKALTSVTAAVTAIGTAAVKTTGDFDAAMSQVSAVSGATGDEFDQLRDKAREMGAKTKFSAEEAAEAMNYMAMAGWKTGDMLDGIEGIMNLAAASGENLGTTSDIVTDALTAFGLTAKDSGHFADILAAASSNANTNVSMLGDSFKYVAPLAGSMGYSAEDVSIALGIMANSGIKASQAGTALRSIITRLAKPTKESANAMEALDLSITNADGTMKPFMEIMEDMRKGFADLTEDEKAFYAAQLGGQEAMSGLLAIVNSSEADFEKLTNAVSSCEGVTQKMADTMQDNLTGQLTILQSQLQEAAISIGDALMPKIRELIGKLQEWTDWFNSLDDAHKELVIEIGLAVAAIGPLLIVIGQMATGLGAVLTAVSTLGPALAAFGAAGGPVLLTVAAFGLMIEAMSNSKDEADRYAESLGELTPEQEQNKKIVDELTESYLSLESKRQSAVSDIENQANMENQLWEELQSIVDENGRVKEGCEERAKVITGQLSEALDTEIEMTGNQIKNYKDLCTSIDELIQKKQANALLTANEAAYAEALTKQTDAYMSYDQAKKDVEETTWQMLKAQEEEAKASEEIERLWKQNIETGEDVVEASAEWARKQEQSAAVADSLKEKLSGLNQTYHDAQTAYEGYNAVIANYEGLSAAIVSNDQAAISEAVLKTKENFLTAETGTRESLERQADEYQTAYEKMKAAVEAGAPGITSAQVENMEKLVALSQEELEKLPELTERVGENVGEGLAKGIKAGSKDAKKAANQLAEETIKELKADYEINSPSKVTEEIGLYVTEGLQTGIEEGTTGVLDTVENTADKTREQFETNLPREQFDTIGQQIAAGLSNGIIAGKSGVLTSIQHICEETLSYAKNKLGIHSPSEEFSYIGEMSGKGFAEGLDGTISEILNVVQETTGKTIAEMNQIFGDIDSALWTLKDSSGNVIAEMVKNTEEAQKALQDIRDGLSDTISSQLDLFDEFDGKAKLSTEEILKNMESQVDGTEQWAENLRILAERGIDQGLLQKMAEMGPKGAGYVTTFSQMTDEQLQRANELFTRSMTLPDSAMESIMQSYKIAGQMTAQGFSDGINENAKQAAESAAGIANESIAMLKEVLEIHSPSKATAEMGQYFDAGLAEGIAEGTDQVTSAVAQVANAATTALNDNLNLSKGNFATFRNETSSGWNIWAAGLIETLKSTLAQINTETNDELQKTKTTIATSISEIETNWKKQLEEIRKDHEKAMTDVNTKTTEAMSEMSETVDTQTEQMKEDAITAMEEMVAGIEENMDKIEPTIRNGFKPGIDYITSLISEARTWGNDMMQGLIQGLEDYLDELEDVCEDIADTISDNLHFTRPERGSLRNYEEWMPHFMQGLAKGIEDNRYLIAEQMKKLTDDMSILQNGSVNMPMINFTNKSYLILDGEQIAEKVDTYLGDDYG